MEKTVSGTTSNINVPTTQSFLPLTQAEVGAQISVTISYVDDGGTSENVTSAATLAVVDVNDAPVFTSGSTASVNENTVISTVVYTVTATDAENNAITYSLNGTDASLLNINSTGEVKLNTSANFEAKNGYSFNVLANDGTGTATAITTLPVTLSIIDVNESPTLSSFSSVTTGNEDTAIPITFANLQTAGDEAGVDSNNSVTAFVVKAVLNGTLKIGTDLLTATTISNTENYQLSGLQRDIYSGYFNDDANWFTSQTPVTTNVDTSPIDMGYSGDNFSIQWTGYFVPTQTEIYTFFTASDDASYLWLGDTAVSGFTTGNALVKNGGAHGTSEQSGTTSLLTAGTSYPIRIQFGDAGGGDAMSVAIQTASIAKTYDLSASLFSIPTIDATHNAYWTPAANANGTLNAFSVVAKDNSNGVSATAIPVPVTVVAVNDAPVFTSGSTASVNENTVISTVVYTITATDAENNAITYSISGTDASYFNIDTGVVTLKSPANYEAKNSYAFSVLATDNVITTPISKAVTVSVIDVNDVYNGNTYILSTESTWQGAEAQAIAMGGHLVTVNDVTENTWLTTTFGLTERLWIGYNDAVTEGTFVWANGETTSPAYTNWGTNQPDNSGDYAVINYSSAGLWDDVGAAEIRRGIIEIVGTVSTA